MTLPGAMQRQHQLLGCHQYIQKEMLLPKRSPMESQTNIHDLRHEPEKTLKKCTSTTTTMETGLCGGGQSTWTMIHRPTQVNVELRAPHNNAKNMGMCFSTGARDGVVNSSAKRPDQRYSKTAVGHELRADFFPWHHLRSSACPSPPDQHTFLAAFERKPSVVVPAWNRMRLATPD